MTDAITVAAVQMVSSDIVAENLATASEFIALAADQGATLVVLPENFSFMGRSDADRISNAEKYSKAPGSDTPVQAFLGSQASRHGVWLVGGTIPICDPTDATRVYSACLCFAPDGKCVARYDKIHLFDVELPDGAGNYRESESTVPGTAAVVAETSFGGLGLAVCYDVRFPELFRVMAGRRLAVFSLCSAFTVATGAAHWEILVRARAVENLTAVVAASQGGDHTAGRQTWGHSMIVDAWGRVLAEQASGAGLIIAEIDLVAQHELRAGFPVLEHRRCQLRRVEEQDGSY